MDPRLEKHLNLCRLDEKRFNKLIRLFKGMLDICNKSDQLVTTFADKCYAQEKDRKLAKLHARTFIEALFGDVDSVLKHGPEAAITITLNEQYPVSKYPKKKHLKLESIKRKKSEKFCALLHEPAEKNITKHSMWTGKLQQYLVGPTLGVGGTAKVKIAYDTKAKTKVAMKILKPRKAKNAEKEISMMKKLNHKNIIRVYDYFPGVTWNNQRTTIFTLEYASHGDLIEYLMYTSKFEDDLARWFFNSLTDAVEYCHGEKVIHRDLKPDNCLLGENFVLKITDFGFATYLEDKFMKTAIGTEQYAAPEIISGIKYTDAVDIFSMGVMLFIALVGAWPWRKADAKTDVRYKMVHDGEWDTFFKYHERSHMFTKDQKVILEGLLQPNPENRWKLEDIKRCKWMNGKNISQSEVTLRLQERKRVVDFKKYRAMRPGAHIIRRAIDIFSHTLPYVYFQPLPLLSFVTKKKAKWVLEDVAKVIAEFKGVITNWDNDKYKLTFHVTKVIWSGRYINNQTKEKEYEKIRVCASVQMWTHPGQEKALKDLEKVLTTIVENKDSSMVEEKELMDKNIPIIKSIAIFRSEGGGLGKYLFPAIYSDILQALPANLISEEFYDKTDQEPTFE